MKKNKHKDAKQCKNVVNPTDDSEDQIRKYEPDDGMVTDEVIEKIKKLVLQLDFKNAESLF